MRKWLWIAPILAASGWSQVHTTAPTILPMAPGGHYVIPAGTEFDVWLDEPLSTNWNRRGDRFTATLVGALTVNGKVLLYPGTRITGHVLQNRRAGIMKGRAKLMLALDTFQLGGRSYLMELTAALCQVDRKHKHLRFADPNADSVTGNRLAATIPSKTVVHFTLGAPVKV